MSVFISGDVGVGEGGAASHSATSGTATIKPAMAR